MPRLFWDIPSIYAAVPDVSKVKNQIGLGAETTFNVASHWGTVRAGGGSTFTLDPKADDLGGSFLATPYLLAEAGAGMYRSKRQSLRQNQAKCFYGHGIGRHPLRH